MRCSRSFPLKATFDKATNKTENLGKARINEQGGLTYTSRKGRIYTASERDLEQALTNKGKSGSFGTYVTVKVTEVTDEGNKKTKLIGLKITHEYQQKTNPLKTEAKAVREINPETHAPGVPKFMYLLEGRHIAVVKHYNMGNLSSFAEKGKGRESYWSVTSGIMQGLKALKGTSMTDIKPKNIVVREKTTESSEGVITTKTEAIITDFDNVTHLPSKAKIKHNHNAIDLYIENMATAPYFKAEDYLRFKELGNEIKELALDGENFDRKYNELKKLTESIQIRQVGLSLAEMIFPQIDVDTIGTEFGWITIGSSAFVDPEKYAASCKKLGLEKACIEKYGPEKGKEMSLLILKMIENPQSFTIDNLTTKFERLHARRNTPSTFLNEVSFNFAVFLTAIRSRIKFSF